MSVSPEPQPWMPADAPAVDERRHAPATLRNREAILAVLADELPATGLVLEVASGSGEHAAYFAAAFPHREWQPSDPDEAALASIRAHGREAKLTNLRPPLALDASAADWPVAAADAILCINMIHISPWAATVGLFDGAARLLQSGAPLIVYGPFLEADVPTAPSNAAFDESLRERNGEWGLRNVADVEAIAAGVGFTRTRRIAMPANNLALVWRKS